MITTPKHYAYLKISEGCDRPCSFCAIPLMRGKHKSSTIPKLVVQARNLASKGVKELILIAQDLTYYGLDIYGKRSLSNLLEELSLVKGIEWIRIHYAFPTGFPKDVLNVIRKNNKICNYIDIPLQHIDDEILRSMKRGTSTQKTNSLIQTFRKEVPNLCLRTTVIVGYPGETEEKFNKLKKWISNIKFDRLGVFAYSHEENTTAFELKDNIPLDVKENRVKEIMQLQEEISYNLNQEKVGSQLKVLFDRIEGGYFVGRTEFDSPDVDNEVYVSCENNYVRIGDFSNVLITSANHFDLYGEVVN